MRIISEENMRSRKFHVLLPFILGALLVGGVIVFMQTEQASAQCGSQASSCKNCHEVQGEDPVNNDGTGWHESHAFGDFCYICHGGNNQSMDKAEAHTGMVPPLSDVQAACASCHPNDLMERAGVYAAALGVDIGTGGGSPPSGPADTSQGSPPSGPADTGGTEPAAPAMVVDSAEVIDYNQQYEETVLGQRSINWGNVIVTILIVFVAVGGGGFVFWNERRLRGLPLFGSKSVADEAARAEAVIQIEGYSPEVSALLPRIAQLNPVGLHALRKLLENPEEASELLHSLSRLDPELVRRIRKLDRESKALLLALSGD
jgi:cytochrome c553